MHRTRVLHHGMKWRALFQVCLLLGGARSGLRRAVLTACASVSDYPERNRLDEGNPNTKRGDAVDYAPCGTKVKHKSRILTVAKEAL